MNILGNNAAKLNELIFANRNKSYGAYAIRSSYNDSLTKSLLILGGFALSLFGAVYFYNKANAIVDDKRLVVDDLKDNVYEYVTPVDITPPEQPQQPQQNMAAAAPTGGMAQRIIDDAPVTNTVSLDNPVNGQGPEGATGTSTTSTLVTTSTVISTPEPATPVVTNTGPLVFAEEMPEFEGGTTGLMKYIAQNVVYPEVAKTIGKEGTVHVSFVINETGNVESVKVVKGIGYGCDEEVVRVVSKMPRWKKVGKNGGYPVKVRFNVPVSFKLK